MALTIKYFVPSDQFMSRMETLQIEADAILKGIRTFMARKYRGVLRLQPIHSDCWSLESYDF